MYRRLDRKAVALRYEPGSYAPYVVSRGSGYQAERILELARTHKIPLFNDDYLATALSQLDPGVFIPQLYWELVARVLLAIKEMKK
ncbi:MAG: EscU/YscU/HrcU family type III secretion system export apparatus switch protein [Spirochaetes bacterium]|nr:EscU/YscU/HrcU family type III secretion system export apparatus switch protein [Spirochaetota bacterium]MBU0955016.1 EscU/YscU/HrcU family type III secretion system export apparatus switch protein [Spirochaetota bacterium]